MSKRGPTLVALTVLTLLLAAMALYLLTSVPETEKEVTLGAAYPLTGPMKVFGEAQREGAMLAVEEINMKGGINGKSIELIVEDNQYDTKTQVSIIQRFIDIDHTDGILTAWTPMTMPIVELIDRNHVPTFTWMAWDVGNMSKYLFNDKTDLVMASRELMGYACKRGTKRLAYVSVKWDLEESIRETVREGIKACGGEIIVDEIFESGEKDFRTLLLKIKEDKDIDSIAIASYLNNLPLLVKQMNEMGLGERRLLGLFALTTEKAVEEGNEQFLLDAKAVSVALPIDPRIPSVSAFIDAFKEEYGKNPRAEAAYAYDSVYILKTALELCDLKDRLDDPDCIAEELLNIKDFSGGAGPAKMDDDGDTIRDMALMEYTSQGWKFLY